MKTNGKAPSPRKRAAKELTKVLGKTFTDRLVKLDGKSFLGCGFHGCTFQWAGGAWWMQDCRFVGSRRLSITNPVALDTVETLKVFGFLTEEFAASWSRG